MVQKITNNIVVNTCAQSNLELMYDYVRATAWAFDIVNPRQHLALAIMLAHADPQTGIFDASEVYDKVGFPTYGIIREVWDTAIKKFEKEELIHKKASGEYKVDKDYFVFGVTPETRVDMAITFKFRKENDND